MLAALGAGALFFFVIAPIVREALARGATVRDLEPESPAKAALAAALHDLEHDFETGKLSVEDRERLRADLRREAMAELARERLGPPDASSRCRGESRAAAAECPARAIASAPAAETRCERARSGASPRRTVRCARWTR